MMPTTRPITYSFITAWLLFVVSMFLAAFDSFRGWECAWFSMRALRGFPEDKWWSIYYFLFTIPNLAMTFSPFWVWRGRNKHRIAIMVFAWCAAAYVMSFAVVAAVDGDSNQLKAGYYLWTGSFIIFAGEWMRQTFLLRLRTGPASGIDATIATKSL